MVMLNPINLNISPHLLSGRLLAYKPMAGNTGSSPIFLFLKKPHLVRQTLRNNSLVMVSASPVPPPYGLAHPVISHFHTMALTSSMQPPPSF